MTQLILIAAAGEQNELGKDNDLPWHLPDDFKRFKRITSGHTIIMGRKTFESFPRPLPDRKHLIITRDTHYTVSHPDCTVVHSVKDALSIVAKLDKAFIIGGGEIYHQFLPYATSIELTRVHASFKADTWFPKIEEANWKLIAEEHHPADERHKHAFTYLSYVPRS
ncbi:dihydrofolate reductase [Robiginitalea sp. IMCC44478]|uniref:dihydrofolate reductase n=1 Tax=Robiginitalea sp. IMCC44478 TaxID=3459122 RepID=UPI00404287A4